MRQPGMVASQRLYLAQLGAGAEVLPLRPDKQNPDRRVRLEAAERREDAVECLDREAVEDARPRQLDDADRALRGDDDGVLAHQTAESGGKDGFRFSRCAARPSFTSGPPKPRNSRPSELSKVGPACRSQLFSAYLVKRIALCAPSAKRVAISSAFASSSSSSTARLMRPMRSASAPSTCSHSIR